MNPNYNEFKFPQIKAHPWHKVCWKFYHYIFLIVHVLFVMVNLMTSRFLDISQANAPWSSGSCLKAAAIFTKSTLHCCKTVKIFFFYECCQMFLLILNDGSVDTKWLKFCLPIIMWKICFFFLGESWICLYSKTWFHLICILAWFIYIM